MSSQRHIRELAIQALYQLDARGEADVEDVHRSITDAPAPKSVQREAIDLATAAWAAHTDADAAVGRLAPDWPTHRQPPVDRSILRLGFYEIVSGRTPAAVAINEAVELAKSYGSDRSPKFVNGVLDRIARQLGPTHGPASEPHPPLDPPRIVEPNGPPPENPLATRVNPDAEGDSDPSAS